VTDSCEVKQHVPYQNASFGADKNVVKGGLVTVQFNGDVKAVAPRKASKKQSQESRVGGLPNTSVSKEDCKKAEARQELPYSERAHVTPEVEDAIARGLVLSAEPHVETLRVASAPRNYLRAELERRGIVTCPVETRLSIAPFLISQLIM
jgi:hypothetical protein